MRRQSCGQPKCMWRDLVLMGVLSVSLVVVFPVSVIHADEGHSEVSDAGLGIGSVLLTIPYGVCKIVYAGLGGIVGGMTWVLTGGNTEAATAIWEPSFYGTYVITPDHLKGNKPVRFLGVSPYDDHEWEGS
ncbi:MAG: hypothetical protein GKS05_05090 [Nitrospirales bacterium]|nr:hypothetical protein [Nitrospirales bacterium]